MKKWSLFWVILAIFPSLLADLDHHGAGDRVTETTQSTIDQGDDDGDTPESEEAGEAESEKKSFWKRYKKEILCGIALCGAAVAARYHSVIESTFKRLTSKKNTNISNTDNSRKQQKKAVKPDFFNSDEYARINAANLACGQDPENWVVSSNNKGKIGEYTVWYKGCSDPVTYPARLESSLPTDATYRVVDVSRRGVYAISDWWIGKNSIAQTNVILTNALCTEWDQRCTPRSKFSYTNKGSSITAKHVSYLIGQYCNKFPEFIILSRGLEFEINVDKSVEDIAEIKGGKTKLFILHTMAAADLYNNLIDQGKSVFALLHTKCPEQEGG